MKSEKRGEGVKITIYNDDVTEPSWVPVIEVDEGSPEAEHKVDVYWPTQDSGEFGYVGKLPTEVNKKLAGFSSVHFKPTGGDLVGLKFAVPKAAAIVDGAEVTILIVEVDDAYSKALVIRKADKARRGHPFELQKTSSLWGKAPPQVKIKIDPDNPTGPDWAPVILIEEMTFPIRQHEVVVVWLDNGECQYTGSIGRLVRADGLCTLTYETQTNESVELSFVLPNWDQRQRNHVFTPFFVSTREAESETRILKKR